MRKNPKLILFLALEITHSDCFLEIRTLNHECKEDRFSRIKGLEVIVKSMCCCIIFLACSIGFEDLKQCH